MANDERAIREVIDTWLRASSSGDTAKVLTLMADDVVFMTPGQEPFGKAEFSARSGQLKGTAVDAKANVVEVKVLGDWAFCRTHLRVTMTPPGGQPMRRTGYTLTIFQKKDDGKWVIARDANLLAKE
jgi:uncharacterized protein (TIGR02246 family)